MTIRTAAILVLGVLALVAASSCVGAEDNPTLVKDLRVIGMSLEPPELSLKPCNPALFVALAAPDAGVGLGAGFGFDAGVSSDALLRALSRVPLTLSMLVLDPQGEGRELGYRLRGCSRVGDRTCMAEHGSVELASGTLVPGENTLRLENQSQPAAARLDDAAATPLIVDVLRNDTYRGLGGIRLPLVLEVATADGAERVYAQKLMVFSCQFLPGQKANQTPIVPGILADGATWNESTDLEVSGGADVDLEPASFDDREESYVVPSFELKPVQLVESWKLAWMTTSGLMSTYETGGTNFAGQAGRHKVRWQPDTRLGAPQNFSIFVVTRDGRGGSSWIRRNARWTP
jgi:hypothetical protein